MTTRMYNKVKKISQISKYGTTYETLLRVLQDNVNIKGMSANQIANIIDLLYIQKEYGANEMYKQLK